MIEQFGVLAFAEPLFVDGSIRRAIVLPIVGLPLLACVLCGLCAAFRVRNKLPAWLTVACLAASFLFTVAAYFQTAGGHGQTAIAHGWDWINFAWHSDTPPGAVNITAPHVSEFVANFSFFIDPLTCLWMLFVTGLGMLIALYASEYMAGDVSNAGYSRFFSAFNLFVFSMACLVMADNLVLLYLGWEGVGLCSYLLIGYFYKKPSAVAAAKKAFIMNRIGDLGLSLGIMLTYVHFGTVEYRHLFPAVQPYVDLALEGRLAEVPFYVQLIPVLFTIGAFGKSAQIPLYVWLPDAMEGPTPVSALIHAATMVTAGVYLVARFFPFYTASEWALPIVAWGGALTAFLAATIGMAQFDIKRIMAYSTVSQLGFMFAGLGFLTAVGGASHVFTHAFFKALLFLACGAVMHGFAGQLDLRKLSGLRKMPGWRIVAFTMLIGCLNLAGFPLITSGFWSKDMIMAEAFVTPGYAFLGVLLVLTAGLTAYYTFRVYFRVFEGPEYYEPGDELHGHAGDADHAHAHDPHVSDRDITHRPTPHPSHVAAEAALAERGGGRHTAHDHRDGHGEGGFHPHPPGWAINTVLVTLALLSFLAIPLVTIGEHHGWVGGLVHGSTAHVEAAQTLGHVQGAEHHAGSGFFSDPHQWMLLASSIVGLIGIAIAYFLHLAGRTEAARSRADDLIPALGPIPRWAQNKWYVDELYHYLFVVPLRVIAHIFRLIDQIIVDGVVNGFGLAPRGAARGFRRAQTGVLHDYALRMVGGVAVVLLIALVVLL